MAGSLAPRRPEGIAHREINLPPRSAELRHMHYFCTNLATAFAVGGRASPSSTPRSCDTHSRPDQQWRSPEQFSTATGELTGGDGRYWAHEDEASPF